MSIKKFIASVIESLKLDGFEKSGKKKSIKRLLEKLEFRKEILNNTCKKKLNKKEKKELKEELAIITLQIKKGEKILNELNTKNLDRRKKGNNGNK